MEASFRSEDVVVKEESKKDRSSDGDELFEREVLVKKEDLIQHLNFLHIGNGKMSHDGNDKNSHSNNQVPFVIKMEKSSVEIDSMTSSSSRNDQDEELESARVEMGEVREENQRLKMCLDQIMKNYRMLQMQFDDIARQDGKKNKLPLPGTGKEVEETDLVALTLGRFPSAGKTISENIVNSHKLIKENDQQIMTQELALGLDCNFDGSRLSDRRKAHSPKGRSPSSNSNEEVKEGEGEGEDPWPPNKGLKTMRSGEDEVMQQNPPKKARVCVRARCDTPTMNDGCQWRKYGQKIAKGNPCPRAYYRCTGAQSCPVRKQVQRCAEDMSILITTYEGTHNHPLSVSATAMASTTSAAAAMLLSGSSTSQFSPNTSAATATTAQANLHGLNFYLSDNSNSKQFYLPNSSMSSSLPTHPTITIDLTSNPSSSSSSSASSSHFGRPFSSSYPPRYPFTNLDFGSSQSNLTSWGNGLLGYGNQLPYNRTQMGTFDIGTYMQKTNNVTAVAVPPRHTAPDPIAAATKAITADPSFQSALAAALTSFIGNGASGSVSGENILEKLKWEEKFPLASSAQKGNGCGSSFISTTPATNSQHGNLTFLPSNSSPFSTSKSASTSLGDNRDHQSS